jgi:hypothetical protein
MLGNVIGILFCIIAWFYYGPFEINQSMHLIITIILLLRTTYTLNDRAQVVNEFHQMIDFRRIRI